MMENTIKVKTVDEPGFTEPTLVLTAFARQNVVIAKEIHHSVNGDIIANEATDEQIKQYNLIVIGLALSFAKRLNLQIYSPVFSWDGLFEGYARTLFEKVRQGKPINYHQQALWPKDETYQRYLKDLVEEIKLLWGQPSKFRTLKTECGGSLSVLTEQIQEIDQENHLS